MVAKTEKKHGTFNLFNCIFLVPSCIFEYQLTPAVSEIVFFLPRNSQIKKPCNFTQVLEWPSVIR